VISDPGAYVKVGATGVTVCVGTEPVGARKCPTVTTEQKTSVVTKPYVGKAQDSCVKVLNGPCQKFKDTKTFRKAQFGDTNKVADCTKVNGFQFCCP